MSFVQETAASEYESRYGRRLWSREARKNYHRLASERKDRVLNAMRHQPIHWEPKVLQVKRIDGTEPPPNNRKHSESPGRLDEKKNREDMVECNGQVPNLSQSMVEVDLKGTNSPIPNGNCKCCQSCPNLSPQNVEPSSNRESNEWLVHIDFDPEKKEDKDSKKEIQTIKVTTTRINQETTDNCGSENHQDKKLKSEKGKSKGSTPVLENRSQTPAKPSPQKENSQETQKKGGQSPLNLSEEEQTSLIVNRLLRPTIRSAPPARPKPNIKHQISKPKVAWQNTEQTPISSSQEVNKSYTTQTTQTTKKHPPFAMYGGNDNGIRRTYNVKPNNKEVHSSALRAKKERERLQIFRKEVERKKPPVIKQPQTSMKLFCDALCAQNKPRETDSWSTEYKRNFTSFYDFTQKKPVFKVMKEFENPMAVSKFLG